MVIELKAAVKDLLDLGCLLALTLSPLTLCLHHFQLDVEVAFGFVGDGDR